MNNQIQQKQASTLYEHYLELRKMREHRLRLLQEQQKRVQQHEQSLFRIRNNLAKAVTNLAKVHDMLNQLVTSDVWVTADEHEKIHLVGDTVQEEISNWNIKKNKKYEQIDREANTAKVHASHILGIERALLCLQDQMRQQFPDYDKHTKNRVQDRSSHHYHDQQQQQQQQLYLGRSKSQCSFTSIVTTTSKNSTSLSGTLLKKWLQPRLQHLHNIVISLPFM